MSILNPALVRPFAVAVALATLLTACSSGGGDTADLREELRIQAQAQASLRERITELESLLVSNDETGREANQLLSGLDEQLQQLTDDLAAAKEELAAQKTAVEDRTAQVDASITTLDARIVELEDRVASLEQLIERLRNDLLSLTDEHELLRAEFEAHERGHSGN